jgi:hypothetical protein
VSAADRKVGCPISETGSTCAAGVDIVRGKAFIRESSLPRCVTNSDTFCVMTPFTHPHSQKPSLLAVLRRSGACTFRAFVVLMLIVAAHFGAVIVGYTTLRSVLTL